VPALAPAPVLTPRWTPLRPLQPQYDLWTSEERFNVIEVPRRSGKTELAKRHGVLEFMEEIDLPNFHVAYFAPTFAQVKSIYWEDLKLLVPPWFVRDISETELKIISITGNRIQLYGTDKLSRFEGQIIDRAYIDEFAEMKDQLWEKHLRPGLSTVDRLGRAWIYGVPRPSMQYARVAKLAKQKAKGYRHHRWSSRLVIGEEEYEASKIGMDPLTFAQEYDGERVVFEGRAYYSFDQELHAAPPAPVYDPKRTLVVCFDFNSRPGTAVVVQEQYTPEGLRKLRKELNPTCTCVIGEVYIPRHSNTELVTKAFLHKWGKHEGVLEVYGDATGGQHKSSGVRGSDWDIIENMLRERFPGRLRMNVRNSNPSPRARINAVNGRIRDTKGLISFRINPQTASNTVDDLDLTMILEGSAGELDKDTDKTRTHLTDALGYYIVERWPTSGGSSSEPLEL
jgi:hypothetical protein